MEKSVKVVNMRRHKSYGAKGLDKGLPNLTNFGDGEIYEGCQYGEAHHLSFDKSPI